MSVQLHAKRFPPQPGDHSLDVALRQLAMTEEQVKGLLSLGRVERQPRALCRLDRLFAEVALLVSPACDHVRVQLRHHAGDDPIDVVADEVGLRAAVLNLTLNAIEAAGPGGQVELATSTHNGEVIIAVSDTGPGPPLALAETLLGPFVTSKPEGVGLGLALAHRVAVEHGGQLSWSRAGGQTHFRLALPNPNGTPEEPR
jgi:signal transduction histidine kinase